MLITMSRLLDGEKVQNYWCESISFPLQVFATYNLYYDSRYISDIFMRSHPWETTLTHHRIPDCQYFSRKKQHFTRWFDIRITRNYTMKDIPWNRSIQTRYSAVWSTFLRFFWWDIPWKYLYHSACPYQEKSRILLTRRTQKANRARQKGYAHMAL